VVEGAPAGILQAVSGAAKSRTTAWLSSFLVLVGLAFFSPLLLLR